MLPLCYAPPPQGSFDLHFRLSDAYDQTQAERDSSFIVTGERARNSHSRLRGFLQLGHQREAQLPEVLQVPSDEAARRQDEILQRRGFALFMLVRLIGRLELF